MTMQKSEDSPVEHMPLEEFRIEHIECLSPPGDWDPAFEEDEPVLPPVLMEEESGYVLVAHHKSLWWARSASKISVRAMVVRNPVHIPVAHKTIENCIEEAMFFDGLLRREIVPNRSRLADMLGYSRARITQVLNVLKLPLEIRQRLLLADNISEFHLRPLVKIDDEKKQMAFFSKLVSDKLTGRQMALFAASDEATETEADLEIEVPDIEEIMAAAEAVEPPPARVVTHTSDSGHRTPQHREAPAGASSGAPPEPQKPRSAPQAPPPAEATVRAEPAARVTAQRAAYMRARGLLESLGTLRQRDWPSEAAKLGAERADIAVLEGISELRKGLYHKAAEILSRVVLDQPENALAWFYLGRSQNLLDTPAQAETSLRRATELIPDDPEFLSELAIVLEKQKRQSEAATFYRRAGALRKGQSAKVRKQ